MIYPVGIAELRISQNADDELVTHALGSCLGVTVYDPQVKVGGLIHVMLPQSSMDPAKAAETPLAFVDLGVPELFTRCYALGADKKRMILCVAGGSSPQGGASDMFQIGSRNLVMLRKILWKNNVLIKAEAVGGTAWRTMRLRIATGEVLIKTEAGVATLLPPTACATSAPKGS